MNDFPAPDPAVLKVQIHVHRRAAEATEEFLWTLGPDAVGHLIRGDEAELTITLPAATADGLDERIASFLRDVDLDTAVTMVTNPYQDEEWETAYRQEFFPVSAGDRIVVAPSWWESPLPLAQITLRIDPQMAFGTGHHPTTLACLEWLARRADILGTNPGGLIDAGCGSGLLAITAHHLGFSPVVAIDNDPVACATARHNAAANAAAAITVMGGDLATTALPAVPTVVANLTAGTIVRLFPRLAESTTADGHIYLSGILTGQEDTVIAAIADRHWQVDDTLSSDGWINLALRRAA
ncbi:MAG: 50S ribosomal protein L11 methyltransferase [Nitrospirota bacterium]|jgi:ribosomal protein L11 methyltransferase